jgi:hypothetical protein
MDSSKEMGPEMLLPLVPALGSDPDMILPISRLR